MEIELLHREPEDFRPITFKLTIETEDELLDLWHRLNISGHKIKKIVEECGATPKTPGSFENLCDFWNRLDEFVRPTK
jgi:hypothetical protein